MTHGFYNSHVLVTATGNGPPCRTPKNLMIVASGKAQLEMKLTLYTFRYRLWHRVMHLY